MSTTLSMWLGISFEVLGIAAVVLQAWLWNPKYWDEVNKKTNAPKAGLLVHRWVGIAFTVIYLVMMWHMVPRLWEYQVELPARTIMHATAAIILGVLLFTKLAILRFFRHFEESMPQLGFGILICTVVIGVLSLPFALQAEGVGVNTFDEANIARVKKQIGKVELPEGVDIDVVASADGMNRGRKVLVTECVKCHDMRTILVKPRSATGWYKVVDRMTEKPSVFGEPTKPEDVPYVTAYLIGITPDLRESRRLEEAASRRRKAAITGLFKQITGSGGEDDSDAPADESGGEPVADSEAAPEGESGAEEAPKPEPKPEPKKAEPEEKVVDDATGEALLEQYCTDCHGLEDITDYGGSDKAGWNQVTRDMIEEGAEIPEDDARAIVLFLAAKYPK